MAVAGYQELQVWKKSMRLALDVYRVTAGFPKSELYGLTSQLRRAAVSIPSNIAEGHCRDSPGDLARFCNIALGSLGEVETQLMLSRELDFTDHDAADALLQQGAQIGRMLRGLIRSAKQNHRSPN